MAQVSANSSSLTITITDPVEMERLFVVLHRSKSTKIAALREAIKTALGEVAADEVITDEVVGDTLAALEAMLNEEPGQPEE